VWFFSLDAARLLAVAGARMGYALPYFWARMSVVRNGEAVRYTSARHLGMKGESSIEVQIADPIAKPSELEVFLTARYRLYARRGKSLLRADVEHPPWALRNARVIQLKETLLQAAGLSRAPAEPIAHFGGEVDVVVGPPCRAI
jgi:uncharacterized protein YqjF (DUF2071 family)